MPRGPEDEERLIANIIELADSMAATAIVKIAGKLGIGPGWVVNDKRVGRVRVKTDFSGGG